LKHLAKEGDSGYQDAVQDHLIRVATNSLFTLTYIQTWNEYEKDEVQKLISLCVEGMKQIHAIKGHDYGDRERPYQNCRISEEMGIPAWKGVLIRLSDKVERLCAFARQGELKVKDESIKDTCIDAANYAIIGLILYRETLPKDLQIAQNNVVDRGMTIEEFEVYRAKQAAADACGN